MTNKSVAIFISMRLYISIPISGRPLHEAKYHAECVDHHALVSAHFLTSFYGNGCCRDIGVYENDSPMTVKIKEFMALYNIIDIKMRMLNVVELKRIQGFPDDYVLLGNQSDQKKFIGNAVHTSIPKAWCPALCRAIQSLKPQEVAV